MTSIELEKKFSKTLESLILENGFRKSGSIQNFAKPFEKGKLIFHVAFIRHESDFDLTADVAVRFNDIEECVHAENKLITVKEKLNTATLGGELGNLQNGSQFRWTILTEADAHTVASEVYKMFLRVGLPYLEKFKDMNHAFQVLSSNEKKDWIHSPFHEWRAMKAVCMGISLKIDGLDELIEKEFAYLKSINDPGLRLFERFIQRHKKQGI